MSKKIRKTKEIIPNSNNLPLTEYWNNLPKRNEYRDNVLNKISKLTGREPGSVRRWFLGTVNPPTERCKNVIAEILECPIECLNFKSDSNEIN